MIKFEHSVFALPFALTGGLLAARDSNLHWEELCLKFAWIVVAMIAARSAAMAFNRIVDAELDALNPRTKMRAIPTGTVSKSFTWCFVAFWSAMLFLAAYMLNPLCLKLAPMALAVVFGYSFMKRFTLLSHFVLGLSLGIAPAAAWVSIRGTLDWTILPLTAAVMLWTAGFDIIYSCQDYGFDREVGVFSLPCAIGIRPSLLVARLLHLGTVALLLWLVYLLNLGWLSLVGTIVVATLLVYEHSLVKSTDLSHVNTAFFAVNGYVSVLFFLFWSADLIFMT